MLHIDLFELKNTEVTVEDRIKYNNLLRQGVYSLPKIQFKLGFSNKINFIYFFYHLDQLSCIKYLNHYFSRVSLNCKNFEDVSLLLQLIEELKIQYLEVKHISCNTNRVVEQATKSKTKIIVIFSTISQYKHLVEYARYDYKDKRIHIDRNKISIYQL